MEGNVHPDVQRYGDRVVDRLKSYIERGEDNLTIFDSASAMADFLIRCATGAPKNIHQGIREYIEPVVEELEAVYETARKSSGSAKLRFAPGPGMDTPLARRMFRESGGIRML